MLIAFCGLMASCSYASGQSLATATREITPSVFGGVSGVYTGLDAGRNLSVMAGVDVTFRPRSVWQPALEYRGMYALDKGGIDSMKNNLGGIKILKSYGHLRPYGDALAGRGETTYANGGYQVPNKPVFYTQSSSNVFSFGGGVDLFSSESVALKLDFQAQRYSSPVTTSGHLFSEVGTVGVVYVFHERHVRR